jgi:hypothetical protein
VHLSVITLGIQGRSFLMPMPRTKTLPYTLHYFHTLSFACISPLLAAHVAKFAHRYLTAKVKRLEHWKPPGKLQRGKLQRAHVKQLEHRERCAV